MAMEIMSILASPITEAGKWLFGAVKHQVSYLTSYNENLENLRNQTNDLNIKRNDVQNMLEEADRRLEEPDQTVLEWIKKAENIQVAVANLNQEAMDNKRCLKGIFPNLSTRLRLSKQALKKLNVIKELREEERNFRRLSHVPPPPSVETVQTDWVEGFTSRDLIMNKVMDALHDENIRSIGVYGMAGIGKTTLVKSLNNKLQGSKLFKKVIMVTVSRDPDLKKIQDNIANRLGLKLEPEDSEFTRAKKLCDRLKKEGPVLLILDDLWKKLDAVRTGIPVEGERMGCKVIITTRIVAVCIEMNIETRVKMDLLSDEEAWALFMAKAGNVATLHNLQSIAEEIARRCKGSPLAIAALGSSLREVRSISQWRRALNILEHPYPSGLEDIMPEVTASLRYSYEYLPGHEIKLMFLFCCLFPEDWDIELSDLRNYGIGEGFLNVNGSLEDASDNLLTYVEKLKSRCLLLDGDEEESVKLHDVVRDVALWIASEEENGFLVNAGTGLRNWSDKEKLKGYRRVSLMKYMNLQLSVPSECPQLQLRSLLIRENEYTAVEQENFFENMKALVVLDMRSKLQIFSENLISVPGSLTCLMNLRMLSLVRCDMSSKVAVLGGMANLEILCLQDSKIDMLPEEIGNLKNLKCLDLTRAKLSAIAPNVISRLSSLEELHAWTEFEEWGNELKSLLHLSSLEVRIRDGMFDGASFPWENLKHFCLALNYSNLDPYSSRSKNNLYLGRVNPVTHWVTKSLSKLTHRLFLESCNGFNNVADLHAKGGFKHLECLEVKSCHEIEYLINVEQESKNALQDLFQDLKELRISDMKNLKKICHGLAPDHKLFGQLIILKLFRCPNLINVLSSNLLLPAQRLSNLEVLRVLECYALQEVFNTGLGEQGEGEGEGVGVGLVEPPESMLSGLRKFELLDVPGLTSIWKGQIPDGSLRNIKTLDVLGCDHIKYLLPSSLADGLQNLEVISIIECFEMENLVLKREERGTSSSRLSLERSPPAITTFQNVLNLGLSECNKLKKLFSFNLALGLRKLQELEIYSCSNLEVIIGSGEEEEAIDHYHGDLLPQLQSLTLKNLQSLTSIFQGNLRLVCPLKNVKVHSCPNLTRPPFDPQCASTLVEIEADIAWFEGLQWEDESQKALFLPFFRLV